MSIQVCCLANALCTSVFRMMPRTRSFTPLCFSWSRFEVSILIAQGGQGWLTTSWVCDISSASVCSYHGLGALMWSKHYILGKKDMFIKHASKNVSKHWEPQCILASMSHEDTNSKSKILCLLISNFIIGVQLSNYLTFWIREFI